MEKNALSLSFALLELVKFGLSIEEATKTLNETNEQMEKMIKKIDIAHLSTEQRVLFKTLLMRVLLVDEKHRTDSFCDEIVKSINVNDFVFGHTQFFPEQLQLTLCARAINKYNDFIFLLMLTESFNFETYRRLQVVGENELKKSISTSLSIFKKIEGGNISLFLFSSILEDSLTTSINPILESVSRDLKLRQHFIMEPQQLLRPLSNHVAEKVKSAIYLSDALIKVS